MSKKQRTPLMRQYHQIKDRHPDTIVLFRLGDFYETFEDDAAITSRVCGITLTKRGSGTEEETPLAGFPWHQLDNYLPKLVRAGYRVAVCEQLEDPKLARGIVRRDVIEVVTPGVALSDRLLDAGRNNYLAAVVVDRDRAGLAFCDVSTGEFQATSLPYGDLGEVLESIGPAEVIISRAQKSLLDSLRVSSDPRATRLEEWIFDETYALDRLREHFGTQSLKGFGFEGDALATIAAGGVMHYLMETQRARLGHIRRVTRYAYGDFISLDPATKRNLEILFASHDGGRSGSLLNVIDRTSTPMGGRLLKKWALHPLKSREGIEKRLAAVEGLYNEISISVELEKELRGVGDLERLVSRVATMRASPRDLGGIRSGLDRLPRIAELVERTTIPSLLAIARSLQPLEDLVERLSGAIPDEPPATLSDGGSIRTGFSPELDELRDLRASGKTYLESLQERERSRTGISSLKVGFNNVFGYYIEVTHTHKDKVPAEWTRKQTLTNAERYITAELKEYEEKILGAEEKILALETRLFAELVQAIAEYIAPVQLNASLLARLDVLQSFAAVATKWEYTRPEVNDSRILDIKGGRHPVIERQLPPGEQFVANDIYLDPDNQQILMITGPNMSGKSALLRQAALITLLAQIGSFVPAAGASVGIVDKIFTRVGASDNISSGESTFMVEMNETASILHNLSDRSLLLLDEIGRGTATYDGISIAWAIAEFLHEHPSVRAKTLFATHYHELNEMAATLPRIRNFHVAVKETGQQVLFLRKLVPGGSEHSFGIHVAKLAGIPVKVVQRAGEILKQLEDSRGRSGAKVGKDENVQLSFFQLDDPVLEQIREEIRSTDLDHLTPVQALNKLNEIKKLIGG